MAGIFHEFLSHLKGTGLAKSSHFQVFIPLAPRDLDKTVLNGRTLSFRCESAELPGRQLVTQDSRIYGPVYKTPYQSVYQDITLTFLETGDFFVRRFFETWMNIIFNSVTNTMAYPNEYRSDILITQYDMSLPSEGADSLATIATWQLVSAFPTAVNQMPVAWTEDGFHRVSVTLAYEFYVITRPQKPAENINEKAPTSPKQTQGSARN